MPRWYKLEDTDLEYAYDEGALRLAFYGVHKHGLIIDAYEFPALMRLLARAAKRYGVVDE